MDLKRPRKLDLNKPLLSTKRLSIVVSGTSCSSTSVGKTVQNNTSDEERVPFSWEKAAGKPKDVAGDHNEEETPRLRLPPCLWHPPNEEPESGNEADKGNDHHQDQEGCVEGDDDDDDEKFDIDLLSDAMEVFSLSDALDIVQKSERARRKSANEGLRLKLEEDSNNNSGNESPNYLIKRFLPDATALAASSTLHLSKSIMMENKICDNSGSYMEAYVTSPKGCGLEVLFPWRLKHKLCAMKSPVLPCSSISMQKQQHQNRGKIRGSAHKHCTNYKV